MDGRNKMETQDACIPPLALPKSGIAGIFSVLINQNTPCISFQI